MINRQNYADVQAHLAYRDEVFRDAQGTRDNRWSGLRMLLTWADATLLSDAPGIRPAFPAFLAQQTRDGAPLAQSTVEGFVAVARTFFRWAQMAYPRYRRGVPALWLDTLQAPAMPTAAASREVYTLEDVQALMAADDGSLRSLRIRAASAFLFLSAMRAGAFVTLPIKAVDLTRREVHQWTSLGVKTKFSKTATTHLMEIPELMDVVREWDTIVRRELPGAAMWYANLSVHPTEPKHVVAVTAQTRNRSRGLRTELQWLCAQAGIPYLSPHHFRHGFVVHAEAHAQSMADRKAISQTLMHSDLSITDGVYGRLKVDDVRDRVGRLGGGDCSGDRGDVIARLEAILAELRGNA